MYYPLSQITTNLYTNGGEFLIKSTNQPYIGYYWSTSDGEFFSGKTPQDELIQKLIPFISSQKDSVGNTIYTELYSSVDVEEYISITSEYVQVQVPVYSPNIPTPQDYEIGEYRRCFCKKTNEIIYLEISKDIYNRLISKDTTIEFEYYLPFNIPWQLTGDKEQVFTVNRNIVALTMKQLKLPKFDLYLKGDYTKYYI